MEIGIHQSEAYNFDEKELERLIRSVSEDILLVADSIDVILCGNDTITRLHRQYLGDDTPTDVITFNVGETAIEGEIYLGMDVAMQNAEYFGVSVSREVCRLIIHGLLHLHGYDDQTESDRQRMKPVENMLVEKYAPA